MNRNRLKHIIATTIFSMVVAFSVPVEAFANTEIVQKVSANFENGKPVSKTITKETKLYYGTSIQVANLSELKTQIETCLINKGSSVSLKYTGGDITKWADTITASINEVLEKTSNDYTRYTMKGYSYTYNTAGEITISFTYIETAVQSQFVANKVKEVVQAIITPGMTDEQKEKAINDYIVSNLSYDTSLVQHSAYAGLVSPYKTVCQGYALLAYKMLTEAGLEARIISGTANGGAHAWNLVKINGSWYHLDTTWNDPVPDVTGRIRYDYFNLQDAQIGDSSRKHSWDKSKYIGYECGTPYVTNDPDILSSGRMSESKAPDINNITIVNNVTVADNIKVAGLNSGDVLKVFSDASTSAKVLGTVTVPAGATEVKLNVPQLGIQGGKVYFSVSSKGKIESPRIEKEFAAESVTTEISAEKVTIENTTAADKVKVSGLLEKDIVKVYDKSEATAKLLGMATVASGKTEATISIAQVGKLSGKVYITVTNNGKRESAKVEKTFDAEPISVKPEVSNITTTNNVGVADTVKVIGLTVKDIVKVYDKSDSTKKLLGTATVSVGKTEAMVNIPKFLSDTGNVYVTVTSSMKLESELVEKAYTAEQVTEKIAAEKIAITNAISGDKIIVTGLLEKDTIKVYDKADGTAKLLGKAVVASGKTEGTISVTQLGKLSGTVYVTVTGYGKKESEKVEKAFAAEPISIKPEVANITTTNNVGVADTVKVTGLTAKDIVKVYDKSDSTKKLLGTATVSVGKTEAMVNIPKFLSDTGNVYVTVTSPMKLESELVEKAYTAEQVTEKIAVEKITITNAISGDKIIVTGLSEKDTIKVYDKADGTAKLLGKAVVASGKTEGTISVTQLGKLSGNVYVTVTSYGKKESEKVEKAFAAE